MGKPLGQVIVCLRKTQKSLSRKLSPRKEDLVRKSKITGTPAETVDISSVVHRSKWANSSSGFNFKPVINASAGSFSSVTTKKQCRRLITLMYHDNI